MKKVLVVWPNWCGTSLAFSESRYEDFIKALDYAGLSSCDIQHLVIVDEAMEQGSKPRKTQVIAHKQTAVSKMSGYNPDVVIAMGSTVFSALTGLRKMTSWIGRFLETSEEWCPQRWKLVPFFHPDHIASQPKRAREWNSCAKVIASAFRIGFAQAQSPKVPKGWKYCYKKEDVAEALADLKQKAKWPTGDGYVVYDYETTGLNAFEPGADIRCVAFCTGPEDAVCIDLERPNKKEIRALVGEFLCDPEVKVAAHNAKFEYIWTRVILGVEPNIAEDSMVLHHLLHEEASHRLESLAMEYTDLGEYDRRLKDALESGETYASIPMQTLWPYCCGDVDATYRVLKALHKELESDPNNATLTPLYYDREIPAIVTLGRVQIRGMQLSQRSLKAISHNARKSRDRIRNKFIDDPRVQAHLTRNGTGTEELNLGSSKQACTLLYTGLGYTCPRPTASGANSANKENLEILSRDEPLAAELLKYRKAVYDVDQVEELRKYMRPNGIVASEFRKDIVVTGRLSSTRPNLQNESNTTQIKRAFVSRFENGELLQADFSQLEVRLLGICAQEPEIHHVYEEKLDIHSYTASKIFDKPLEEVTKRERTEGKRTNFGILYGIGPKKLALEINNTPDYARDLLNQTMRAYPKIQDFLKQCHNEARNNKRIVSPSGRVRRLPDIESRDTLRRLRAERQAANFFIASLGADITMDSMTALDRQVQKLKLRSLVIGQIHDSIIVDVHPDETDQIVKLVEWAMYERTHEVMPWLSIPLLVDMEKGKSWKTLETFTL